MIRLKYLKALFLFAGAGFIAASCNKSFPNPLESNSNGDLAGVVSGQRKVLMVIIDGARGEALKYAAPPNLSVIADNAVYTVNGLADYERTNQPFSDENAWTNLLTGVTQTKHNVISNNFSGNNLAAYPSLFTRIKSVQPSLRTAAFCSSTSLKDNLLSDATVAKSLANDAAVKTETLAELKNPDAAFIMAQFHGVKQAGDQYGYDNNIPEYLTAIRQVDAYIGELTNELSKRPNYAKEKWLVVIASSKGGAVLQSSTDITGYGDARRNSFVFFYNPKFLSKLLEKPVDSRGAGTFKGSYVNLFGIPGNATIPGVNIQVQNSGAGGTGAGPYTATDLDFRGAYTVEAKIKLFRPIMSNMPFFSKTPQRSGSGNNSGWAFRTSNTTGEIFLWFRSDDLNTASRPNVEFRVGNIADTMWHTIAATFVKNGNLIVGTGYLDGLLGGSGSIAVDAPGEGLVTTSPIKLGFNDNAFVTNGQVNIAFADVRVWSDALPSNIIYQYSCMPGIPPANHPYRNKLTGFWSCRAGSGTTIIDETGNGRNAIVGGNGAIQWKGFSEVNNAICPEPENLFYRKVPNTIDIPFQVFRWLGINNTTNWNLDGIIWLTSFDGL